MSTRSEGFNKEGDMNIQAPQPDPTSVRDVDENDKIALELTAVSALRSLGMHYLEPRPPTPIPAESDGEDSDCEEMMAAEVQSSSLDNDSLKDMLLKKKTSFPQRLMEVLSTDEYSNIISWLPHGKSFLIKNRKRFGEIILTAYFKKSLFPSFTRKLNRWGFIRIGKGVETGAYCNKYFLRDDPTMLDRMRCQKRNERKKRPWGTSDEDNIRDIYEKSEQTQNDTVKNDSSPSDMTQSEQMHRFRLLYLMRLKHRQEHRLLMAATLQKQLDLYEQNNKESLGVLASLIDRGGGLDVNHASASLLTSQLSASLPSSQPNLHSLDHTNQSCSIASSTTTSTNQGKKAVPTIFNSNSSGLASIASVSSNTLKMKSSTKPLIVGLQKGVNVDLRKTSMKERSYLKAGASAKDNISDISRANAA